MTALEWKSILVSNHVFNFSTNMCQANSTVYLLLVHTEVYQKWFKEFALVKDSQMPASEHSCYVLLLLEWQLFHRKGGIVHTRPENIKK